MIILLRNVLVCMLLTQISGCGFVIVRGVRHAYAEYGKQQKAVAAELARYGGYVRVMENEKVADMFDPEGELSVENETPVVGRGAILKFLNTAPRDTVIDYAVSATTTAVEGTRATQKGHYYQKALSAAGETVQVHGSFEATWAYQRGGQWLISRMHTTEEGRSSGG